MPTTPIRSPRRSLLAMALCGAAASLAPAQTTSGPATPTTPAPSATPAAAATPPTSDPAMFNPGVDRTLQDQSRQGLKTDPIDPIQSGGVMSSIPSVAPPDLAGSPISRTLAQAPRATAEGAVSGTLTGRLYRVASGELIFATSTSAAGTPTEDRAFVLLPNQTLSQLSGATSGLPDGQPITLSGQVFTYRASAYLLPLSFAITREQPAAPVSANATSDGTPEAPSAPAAAAPASDPRVADLINRLEQTRQPRALDAAMLGSGSQATDAAPSQASRTAADLRRSGDADLAQSALAPEGTLILRARARLVRPTWAAGRLAAAFDNDPRSPNRGTMLLVPCRVLEQAEALAGQLGEDATFSISGRVTIHEGRNYLLPILIQRLPRTDITPGQ